MKRILSALIFLMFIGFAVYAEKTYTVSAVSGEVSFRQRNGKWQPLKVGMNLSDNTRITTGLNSTIVITSIESTVVILPLKTGSVSDVVSSGKGSSLIKKTAYSKN